MNKLAEDIWQAAAFKMTKIAESDRDSSPLGAAISALGMGAGTNTAGLAGLGYYGLNSAIDIGENTMAQLSRLKNAPAVESMDFVHEYADAGSKLLNSGIKLFGKDVTGDEFIKRLRSGVLGQLLGDFQLHSHTADADSLHHYDAFKAGKETAIKKMLDETFSDNAGRDLINEYKRMRWEALKDAPATQAELIDRIASKSVALPNGASSTISDVNNRTMIRDIERILQRTDPMGYKRILRESSMANAANDAARMSELDAIKEQLFRNSGLSGLNNKTLAREIARGKSRNPFARGASGVLKWAFDPEAKAYSRIYDVFDTINSTKRGLKYTALGGAGLAGLSALGLGYSI